MRTKNSIINSVSALLSYAILFLGPFFVSPFLESILGKEILGIQKTFLDTIALLSVVELGISYGIIYKLYGPIADKDNEKIAVLLNFYKTAFKTISLIVLFLGVGTAFVIPKIVSGNYNINHFSNKWLSFVFLLYVLDTLFTYLFGHKRAMLIADQRNYVVIICRTVCQLLMFTTQILIIYFFRSFAMYVAAKVFFTLLESLFVNVEYYKRYSDINLKTKKKMDKDEARGIFKNLNALFYHKVGYQSLISGSTLIMTNKLGKAVTGIYYPYTLITNGVISATTQVFNAILSSFGSFIAKNTTEKTYKLYNRIYFLNHTVFCFFTVSIFCLITPFVSLWMGPDFMFPIHTIILITINFYLLGMRQSVMMAKSSVGLYRPDKYLAVVEAGLNFVLSWILVGKMGIDGILIANLISTLAIPFWTQPYLVYKNIFYEPVSKYYKKYLTYFSITTCCTAVSYWVCGLFNIGNIFLKLATIFGVCLVVPNTINLVLFRKTEEFKYLLEILKGVPSKFKKNKDITA